MNNNKPIGIFDSGLGGLTILKEMRRVLPKENIIYFGDSAHVPYGSKSPETVTEFSMQIAKFLETLDIKFLVVACNTASAFALPKLQKEIKVPVIGVIEAGALQAACKTKKNHIAVIGTQGTINSGSYPAAIKKLNKKHKVFALSAPLLVPVIEEGWGQSKVASMVAKEYIAPVIKSGADTLILGCTHYPIIKPLIKKLAPKLALVDSAEAVCAQLKDYLTEKDMLKTKGKPLITIFSSDAPKAFGQKAAIILESKPPKVMLKKF
ncbi:glutamate racemase [Elusimicrobium posterum]|uniref:glutamate racemase n=1 Tax=Elusimicrobium posterum TaxID=3116653 RepID=UPI003C767890